MERTKYFNNTKPGEDQLNNTEDSRVKHILDRARANCQFGIVTGFRVFINPANNTKIDIGPGKGFTGGFYSQQNYRGPTYSGEIIDTTTSPTSGATAEGIGLVDYSSNTKNYVSLVYIETTSDPLQERDFQFTPHDTIYTGSYTVEVLTEINFLALSADEIEQRILVCVVTAQGHGGALSLSNVDQFVQPKNHPTAENQPINITGVTITGISGETLIGTGVLYYDGANTLFWTAPGDLIGTGVVVGSSTSITLYSNNLSYWIDLEISSAGLPATSKIDNIGIGSVYGRELPMGCSIDQAHRDMLGTGIVSPTNIHGTSINDISGGGFDHATLFHVNGISIKANSNQLYCTADDTFDNIVVTNLGGFDNSFIIEGKVIENLSGVANASPGYVHFDAGADVAGDYMVYVTSDGILHKVKIAGYVFPGQVQPLWDTNIQIIDIHNEIAGSGATAGTITWDNTDLSLQYQAPGDGAPGSKIYIPFNDDVGYVKLFSGTATNWIIVNIDGSIGGSNSSSFDCDKDETSYADKSILKLCIVNWTGTGDDLNTTRDIRNYITADVMLSFLQEHDADGYHKKVLRDTLNIAMQTGPGIYARVQTNQAILGAAPSGAIVGVADNSVAFWALAANSGIYANVASNTGVVGSAGSLVGVYGYAATDTGVYGYAVTDTGVYGSAVKYGVYGAAITNGVYGTANTFGVYGHANNYGIFGSAVSQFGVYGQATEYGVYGVAQTCAIYGEANNTGVLGLAVVNTGVYGEAAAQYGVYGAAITDGVYGTADTFGVHGEADNYGVYGAAANQFGVYGVAVKDGVYGKADTYGVEGSASNYGVYGYASVNYGVLGKALSNIGVYGSAILNTGVCGIANINTGIYGEAASSYGVFAFAPTYAVSATGSNLAVYAQATLNANATAYGIYGRVHNASVENKAIAIMGIVSGSGATGIYGVNTGGANGTGIYGIGADYGVFVDSYLAYRIETDIWGYNSVGGGTIVHSNFDMVVPIVLFSNASPYTYYIPAYSTATYVPPP